MNKQLHARKRRQFKSLSKQLNRLLQGEHSRASKQKIEAIMLKIKHLIRELSGIIARWEMKKTLGVAAVMFGLATTPVQGQSFADPVVNPFNLSSSISYVQIPVLADMDDDGDMDLLVSEYDSEENSNFGYYENIGTASEPSFGALQMNPFGLVLESPNAIFSTVGDLDNDGDLDVFVSTYKSNVGAILTYYENTGTVSEPSFIGGQDSPFGTTPFGNYSYLSLALADLDGDGDLDIITGSSSYYGSPFNYLENIGTASEPNFSAPQGNPFGLSFSPNVAAYLPLHAVADLDSDGDLDLICGVAGYSYINGNEYYNGMYYFQNTGSETDPQFEGSERNPLGIIIPPSTHNELLIPALADLDNDGDMDMLCTAPYGAFVYYENTLDPVSTTAPQADFPVNISPNPTNNYLNINTDESLTQIEIYDLFGRQLATYDGQQTLISIQDLSKGTYVIRLINQEGQYLSKRVEKL